MQYLKWYEALSWLVALQAVWPWDNWTNPAMLFTFSFYSVWAEFRMETRG